MSKSSGKVRFGYIADGERRELFAAKVTKDDSILLYRRVPKGLRENNIEYGFVEQHISIHSSYNSSGTTITQKSIYQGKRRSRVSFIRDSKKKLIYPVLATIVGYSLPGNRLMQHRNSDQILLAAMPYNFDDHTLYVSIFVTRNYGPEIKAPPATSFAIHNFGQFQLIINYNYIALPSFDNHTIFKSTSTSIDDDLKTENHEQWDQYSLGEGEIPEYHLFFRSLLLEQHLQNIRREDIKSNPHQSLFDLDARDAIRRAAANVLKGCL